MTSVNSTPTNGVGSSAESLDVSFNGTVDLIKSEHITTARSSVRDPEILQALEDEIERDCEFLRSFLLAAQVIDEISPRSKDSIVGYGERLGCKVITAILRDRVSFVPFFQSYLCLRSVCMLTCSFCHCV